MSKQDLHTLAEQAGVPAPLLAALVEGVAGAARPPDRYDRLTPAEAYEELRISKSAFYELVRANEIRLYYDLGVPFVPRWELDRYKRETAEERPGPISNDAAKRHDRQRKKKVRGG